jgi:hypothetical protein
MTLSKEEWEARKAATLTPEEFKVAKRKAALAKSLENIKKDQESYRATSGMSGMDRFMAGAGSGTVSAGRNMANMLGIDKIGDFDTTDAAIEGQNKTDEDLLSTGAGLLGNIAGGAAATAPIGMGAGALVGSGSKLLSNLPRLAKAIKLIGGGAAQGAAEGAILGGPGGRGEGALVGGAFGGAIPAVGLAAKKTAGWLGKDRRSLSARELQKEMDITSREAAGLGPNDPLPKNATDIPASHGLEPGIMKQVYEGFVSNMPGSATRLRGQYDEAVGAFRESAIRHAAPEGASISSIFQHGDDLPQSLGLLKKAWDDAFDTVNTSKFRIPNNFFPLSLRRELSRFDIRLPQGNVLGKSLTDAKVNIQALINDLPKGPLGAAGRKRLTGIKSKVDALIHGQLPADAAAQWSDDLAKYKNFEDLMAAAKKKPGTSQFTPKDLAAETSKRAGRKGLFGAGGSLQDLGRLGQEVLPNFPSRAGVFQTLAAMGAAQGLAGGLSDNKGLLGSGLATVLLPLAAARGLSNRAVQRKIMEGMSSAKGMENLVNQFPEAMSFLRRYAVQGAVAAKEERPDAP